MFNKGTRVHPNIGVTVWVKNWKTVAEKDWKLLLTSSAQDVPSTYNLVCRHVYLEDISLISPN